MSRNNHVGKNPYEKEAYRNFLNQHFKLDKTVEDPDNFSKTDSSAFEKEDIDKDFGKPQKKSLGLKIKDFFDGKGIVTGIVILLIGGGFSVYVRQSVESEQIAGILSSLDATNKNVTALTSDISTIKINFEGLSVGFGKDIQYIKNKLGIK